MLVLLSGVVIWWPKTRRMLRNSLKITVSKGRHLLWRGLHVAGGMYVLLLLLVMALTGLTWSFQWYSKGFYALFGVSEVPKSGAVAYAEQAKKEKARRKETGIGLKARVKRAGMMLPRVPCGRLPMTLCAPATPNMSR